jgi:hypothetical protein
MTVKYLVLAISCLAFFSGCGEPPVDPDKSVEVNWDCLFQIDRVHVIGLTSIESKPDDASSSVLTVYLSLQDSFASSIKVPAIFWFELYKYVPRSPNPRGTRLYLSSEFDLNGLSVNNDHWEDFLRAYKFTMDATVRYDPSVTYVLQITCVTPDGRRLMETFYLNKKKKMLRN